MRRYAGLTLAVCAALACSSSFADSFRCGSYLIREGMPAAEIESKCGAPTSRQIFDEPIMARRPNGTAYRIGTTRIEQWTYYRGADRFPMRITIDAGNAKRIERLPKY